MNVRELDAEQQRRTAFRALLAAPFVGAGTRSSRWSAGMSPS